MYFINPKIWNYNNCKFIDSRKVIIRINIYLHTPCQAQKLEQFGDCFSSLLIVSVNGFTTNDDFVPWLFFAIIAEFCHRYDAKASKNFV